MNAVMNVMVKSYGGEFGQLCKERPVPGFFLIGLR